MNKFIISLSLLFCSLLAISQNGLEQIVIEKYYVSDANDATADATGGILPVGSTTYRIYVDMLPGYIFQAAYGLPNHELRIATSTTFFNNEDRGATTPRYSKSQASRNTVMLDSWLSVGAACVDNFGVLKTEDDGVSNLVNKDGLLKNNDSKAGIPLTQQDGLLDGSPEGVITVGITKELSVFDDQNSTTNGDVFSTFDGSWASLNGSMGPDTIENKVLIAQITTNGELSFCLNIQVRSPNFEVEQYVAKDPIGAERSIPSLCYPLISGSQNISSESKVSIYPNPANNYLTINVLNLKSKNNFYSIYDAKGNLLEQNKFTPNASTKHYQKIDISKYSNGMYFVTVSLDGKTNSQKIVKN